MSEWREIGQVNQINFQYCVYCVKLQWFALPRSLGIGELGLMGCSNPTQRMDLQVIACIPCILHGGANQLGLVEEHGGVYLTSLVVSQQYLGT